MRTIAFGLISLTGLAACGGSTTTPPMMMQPPAPRVDASVLASSGSQSNVQGDALSYTTGFSASGNPVYSAFFTPAASSSLAIGTMGTAQWSGDWVLDTVTGVTGLSDPDATINGTRTESVTGRSVVTVDMGAMTVVGGGDGLSLNGSYTATTGVVGTATYGGITGTLSSGAVPPTASHMNLAVSGEDSDGNGFAGGQFLTPGL